MALDLKYKGKKVILLSVLISEEMANDIEDLTKVLNVKKSELTRTGLKFVIQMNEELITNYRKERKSNIMAAELLKAEMQKGESITNDGK